MTSLVTNLNSLWLAQKIGNWVTTDDWCVHTADTTQLDFIVGELFSLVETRRDCRQLVANSIHTADATQLDSWVASASAVCIATELKTGSRQPNFCRQSSRASCEFNTHRRRRRDLTRQLSRVGVGGVFGHKSKLAKFGLSDSLSQITLLFDLSLYLDRTLAQRKAQRKAKSKVKVTICL